MDQQQVPAGLIVGSSHEGARSKLTGQVVVADEVRERARSVAGLDHMLAVAAGERSRVGIVALLDMRFSAVADGEVDFEFVVDDRMLNPQGTLHGGVIATALDSAMGAAVHTTLGDGFGHTTAQLNIHYVRPAAIGVGTLLAHGAVIHRGRTQCTAEGRLTDSSGRLLAHATSTFLILKREP